MIGIGEIYRQVRDSERIALATHALGLFVAYSAFGAFFNIVFLPRPTAPIDAALIRRLVLPRRPSPSRRLVRSRSR